MSSNSTQDGGATTSVTMLHGANDGGYAPSELTDAVTTLLLDQDQIDQLRDWQDYLVGGSQINREMFSGRLDLAPEDGLSNFGQPQSQQRPSSSGGNLTISQDSDDLPRGADQCDYLVFDRKKDGSTFLVSGPLPFCSSSLADGQQQPEEELPADRHCMQLSYHDVKGFHYSEIERMYGDVANHTGAHVLRAAESMHMSDSLESHRFRQSNRVRHSNGRDRSGTATDDDDEGTDAMNLAEERSSEAEASEDLPAMATTPGTTPATSITPAAVEQAALWLTRHHVQPHSTGMNDYSNHAACVAAMLECHHKFTARAFPSRKQGKEEETPAEMQQQQPQTVEQLVAVQDAGAQRSQRFFIPRYTHSNLKTAVEPYTAFGIPEHATGVASLDRLRRSLRHVTLKALQRAKTIAVTSNHHSNKSNSSSVAGEDKWRFETRMQLCHAVLSQQQMDSNNSKDAATSPSASILVAAPAVPRIPPAVYKYLSQQAERSQEKTDSTASTESAWYDVALSVAASSGAPETFVLRLPFKDGEWNASELAQLTRGAFSHRVLGSLDIAVPNAAADASLEFSAASTAEFASVDLHNHVTQSTCGIIESLVKKERKTTGLGKQISLQHYADVYSATNGFQLPEYAEGKTTFSVGIRSISQVAQCTYVLTDWEQEEEEEEVTAAADASSSGKKVYAGADGVSLVLRETVHLPIGASPASMEASVVNSGHLLSSAMHTFDTLVNQQWFGAESSSSSGSRDVNDTVAAQRKGVPLLSDEVLASPSYVSPRRPEQITQHLIRGINYSIDDFMFGFQDKQGVALPKTCKESPSPGAAIVRAGSPAYFNRSLFTPAFRKAAARHRELGMAAAAALTTTASPTTDEARRVLLLPSTERRFDDISSAAQAGTKLRAHFVVFATLIRNPSTIIKIEANDQVGGTASRAKCHFDMIETASAAAAQDVIASLLSMSRSPSAERVSESELLQVLHQSAANSLQQQAAKEDSNRDKSKKRKSSKSDAATSVVGDTAAWHAAVSTSTLDAILTLSDDLVSTLNNQQQQLDKDGVADACPMPAQANQLIANAVASTLLSQDRQQEQQQQQQLLSQQEPGQSEIHSLAVALVSDLEVPKESGAPSSFLLQKVDAARVCLADSALFLQRPSVASSGFEQIVKASQACFSGPSMFLSRDDAAIALELVESAEAPAASTLPLKNAVEIEQAQAPQEASKPAESASSSIAATIKVPGVVTAHHTNNIATHMLLRHFTSTATTAAEVASQRSSNNAIIRNELLCLLLEAAVCDAEYIAQSSVDALKSNGLAIAEALACHGILGIGDFLECIEEHLQEGWKPEEGNGKPPALSTTQHAIVSLLESVGVPTDIAMAVSGYFHAQKLAGSAAGRSAPETTKMFVEGVDDQLTSFIPFLSRREVMMGNSVFANIITPDTVTVAGRTSRVVPAGSRMLLSSFDVGTLNYLQERCASAFSASAAVPIFFSHEHIMVDPDCFALNDNLFSDVIASQRSFVERGKELLKDEEDGPAARKTHPPIHLLADRIMQVQDRDTPETFANRMQFAVGVLSPDPKLPPVDDLFAKTSTGEQCHLEKSLHSKSLMPRYHINGTIGAHRSLDHEDGKKARANAFIVTPLPLYANGKFVTMGSHMHKPLGAHLLKRSIFRALL